MLSPRYLAGISDDIVRIYSQLEHDIVIDMAHRLHKMKGVTDASIWQAGILKEIGGLQSDVQKYLAKYDKEAQKEIIALFEEALSKSDKADMRVFDAAKRSMSDRQRLIFEAIAEKQQSAGIVTGSKAAQEGVIKTFSNLSRLTMSIASTSSSDFITQANAAFMQTVSGAFDYNTTLKNAVKNLAQKGIHTVEYTDSGKRILRSIEGAVRSNILTGINQTASRRTLDNCQDLDCDLVEVSAHMGARPSHAAWQGKVYSLSGTSDKYPSFYAVCMPGEPDGIGGVNCRHSYYPYFEGMERMYNDGELDEMKEPTVEYNGKKITQYEAEQNLRALERGIRKHKLEVDALEATGLDATAERQRLGAWQAKARDYCKQTGIQRDYSREYVGTASGKQPSAVKPLTKPAAGAMQKQEKVKIVYAKMQQKEYDDAVANCQKNLTEKQIKQIWSHNYSKGGYVSTANGRNINRILRKIGIESLNADDKETVKILREAISKNTLKKDTILIRNVQPDWIEGAFGIKGKNHLYRFETDIKPNADVKKQIESILKGKTITENQFLSCSVNENKNFFNSFGVRLEIHAPKGTNCYFPDNKEESECILDIGQRLNILDVAVTDKRVNIVCEIITGGKR